MSDPIGTAVFVGLPSYFRALVSQNRLGTCGYELARHTYAELSPSGGDCEEAFDELLDAVESGAWQVVIDWYRNRFPRVMASLPEGWQRREFVNGVFAAFDQGILDR